MPTKPVIESKQCSEKGITKALSKNLGIMLKLQECFNPCKWPTKGEVTAVRKQEPGFVAFSL